MKKFVSNLKTAHKDIRAKKAELIAEDAEAASNKFVSDLKEKQRTIKRSLMDLEDLSPDSTLSLRVTKDNFNATDWIKAIHEKKMELALITEEVTRAEETHAEYFGETEEETK